MFVCVRGAERRVCRCVERVRGGGKEVARVFWLAVRSQVWETEPLKWSFEQILVVTFSYTQSGAIISSGEMAQCTLQTDLLRDS